VFAGESGAGKSTIAEWFAVRGATVLSDERVILRAHGAQFLVYGTPWVGSGNYAENDSAPISGLFEIGHGRDRHALAILPPAQCAARLLRQAILPYWDRLALENTLAFLATLTSRVPCRSLAFLKQADVVDVVHTCLVQESLAAR
jgi:serine kinase of HPr protein (carbohydrate metabolism regulator)